MHDGKQNTILNFSFKYDHKEGTHLLYGIAADNAFMASFHKSNVAHPSLPKRQGE